jgi:transposase-like protein
MKCPQCHADALEFSEAVNGDEHYDCRACGAHVIYTDQPPLGGDQGPYGWDGGP